MSNKGHIPYIVQMFYGVFLYEVAGLISLFFEWSNYLCMLGVIITIIAYIRAPKKELPHSANTSITLLYVVLFFMILRGSIIGNTPHLYGEGPLPKCSMYDIIRFFLVNPYSAFAVLFPLVIKVDNDPQEFKHYGRLALIASVLSMISFWIFKDYIVSADVYGFTDFFTSSGQISVRNLANIVFVGLGMILCVSWSFQYFYNNKLYWILPIVLFISFCCNVSGGGRGNSVIAFAYMFLFFLFLYQSSKTGYVSKHFIRSVFIISFIVFAAVLYYLVTNTGFLDLLMSRTFEDGDISAGFRESTREDFVNAMIKDFNSDGYSWLIGRGVNGCFVLTGNVLRNSLEWGYMWLILKGGVIYMVLYIYILLKAFTRGFFHSNSMLAKSLGLLCLVQVLLLIPFGLPTVSVQCLLVWHSVRLLNSEEFTELSDNEVNIMLK